MRYFNEISESLSFLEKACAFGIHRRHFREGGLTRKKDHRRCVMAGVQGSDPVLICIYTKKTLRWLRVAILETQREKQGLHGDGEKRKGKRERRKGLSVRHGTRFGASLMTLEIQFRLHRNLEIPPRYTLRDNFVTVEMYQRRYLRGTRDKIRKAELRDCLANTRFVRL